MMADYAYVVQQLRLVQAASLGLSAISTYSEADRIGLGAFLILMLLICAHLYVVLLRWHSQIDGRYDFESIFSAHNVEAQVHYGIQVFSPSILSLLVHVVAPVIPSSSSALLFDFSHYLTIATSFIVLGFDAFGGIKKKLT